MYDYQSPRRSSATRSDIQARANRKALWILCGGLMLATALAYLHFYALPLQLPTIPRGPATLAALGCAYLLPSFVAAVRQHPNGGSVLVVNLFLGWTLIGWVVALAMSVSAIRH